MFKVYNVNLFQGFAAICALFLAACERNALSPVEIKIDESFGYSDIRNTSQSMNTSTIHVVSEKETLFDIAYKYNLDSMHLAKINGISSPYTVKKGQILKLPEENNTYSANTYTSVDMAGKEIPEFSDDHSLKKEKKKDELDEEFEDVILGKNDSKPKEIGMNFNDQAKDLSKPKITETTTGESTKGKSKKDKGKEDSKVEPEKNTKPIEKLQEAFKPVDQGKLSKMIKPVDGEIISKFGDIKDGISNDGINIKAPLGTKVKSAANGTVIYVGSKLEEYGNIVIVQHENGLITSYAHLKDIMAKNGTSVNSGDIIGTVGKTGDVTDSQLYFEVMKDKKPIDPIKYLEK